jgi:metallo-beta-lactamase family protein
MDSAHIQERDAKWLSTRQETFVPPLYTDEDARAIMRQFICLPYEMPFEVAPGIRVTFHDAGHVLGSAMTEVAWEDGGARRRFIYTADIGRHDMPILKDPWEPQGANAVMMESTYGNRDHDSFGTVDDKLADVITRTHARGGKVIVPSFALERAQEFIYALKRLETSGRIPQLPVFVDSPLTVNITEVFRLHTDSFDEEIRAVMEESGDPFELSHIEYVRNVEASKRLNTMDEPMIIISASGMCEYGRIQHHLRNNVADDRNTILIIGFQAKNTLGRRIVEHQREIPIFGIKHPLNAEVQVINALSAHAGKTDLLEFGERFKGVAEKILLVHGEDEALNDLKAGLEERGVDGVHIQEEEETVEL